MITTPADAEFMAPAGLGHRVRCSHHEQEEQTGGPGHHRAAAGLWNLADRSLGVVEENPEFCLLTLWPSQVYL